MFCSVASLFIYLFELIFKTFALHKCGTRAEYIIAFVLCRHSGPALIRKHLASSLTRISAKKKKNISAMHDYRACHTYKQTPYGDCRIVFVYVSFTSTIIIYHCTGRLYGGSHIRHSAILLNWFSVCAQRSWMWWMGSKKFNVCFSYGWFPTNTNETKKKRCFYWFSVLL